MMKKMESRSKMDKMRLSKVLDRRVEASPTFYSLI